MSDELRVVMDKIKFALQADPAIEDNRVPSIIQSLMDSVARLEGFHDGVVLIAKSMISDSTD